jgi:TonB-dependent SusC/RagA subfamily outer membrane receptor
MKFRIIFLLIIVVSFTVPSLAQKPVKRITISGVVTDDGQKPIPGAMVLIDNQKTNSITDNKGFYKVKVKPGAKIITIFTMRNGVSETSIDGRTMINFIINGSVPSQNAVPAKKENEETVNVGYGTMKKNDLTTTVGKINGQNKKYASYQNIYNMISGEVPGVQVNGKSITIQGPSSIYLSTEPLFVVDGIVVNSIDDISPQTVKSIEVLKGPSASIYGSRGSNGVILIYLLGAEKKK